MALEIHGQGVNITPQGEHRRWAIGSMSSLAWFVFAFLLAATGGCGGKDESWKSSHERFCQDVEFAKWRTLKTVIYAKVELHDSTRVTGDPKHRNNTCVEMENELHLASVFLEGFERGMFLFLGELHATGDSLSATLRNRDTVYHMCRDGEVEDARKALETMQVDVSRHFEKILALCEEHEWKFYDSNNTGTWRDPLTGYYWENPPSSEETNWSSAVSYCDSLVLDEREWHLPTISELRTLVRGCPATEVGGACGVTDNCLDSSYTDCFSSPCNGCSGFGPGARGGFWDPEIEGLNSGFWSSSASDPGEAWCVRFADGFIGPCLKETSKNQVRCVHHIP